MSSIGAMDAPQSVIDDHDSLGEGLAAVCVYIEGGGWHVSIDCDLSAPLWAETLKQCFQKYRYLRFVERPSIYTAALTTTFEWIELL